MACTEVGAVGVIEYAAFGWVALKWWTWPLMFVVIMGGMLAGLWLDAWCGKRRDKKADPGPFQCGALVVNHGPHGNGYEVYAWCHQRHGHADDHRDEYGLTTQNYADIRARMPYAD